MTLREQMRFREGAAHADDCIRRGLRAWAVRRDDDYAAPQTLLVFGTSRSDAIRRAQALARTGAPFSGTTWRCAEVTSGWDNPVVWPLPHTLASAAQRARPEEPA
jgi:hypothetical protein